MPSDAINFVGPISGTDVSEEPSLKFHVLERIVATEITIPAQPNNRISPIPYKRIRTYETKEWIYLLHMIMEL